MIYGVFIRERHQIIYLSLFYVEVEKMLDSENCIHKDIVCVAVKHECRRIDKENYVFELVGFHIENFICVIISRLMSLFNRIPNKSSTRILTIASCSCEKGTNTLSGVYFF